MKLNLQSIGIEELEAIAVGGSIFSTAGGGDYAPVVESIKKEMEGTPRVSMMSLDEVTDEMLIACVGFIGAIEGSDDYCGLCLRALRAVEKSYGRSVDALIPFEIGGGNGIIPIAVAARTGLPIIDGDGIGRCFPETQQLSWSIHGRKASPAAVAVPNGPDVIFENVKDDKELEKFARSVSVMSGDLGMCDAPMDGKLVREYSIPRSYSKSFELGQIMLDDSLSVKERIAVVTDKIQGYHIFSGQIKSIDLEKKEGFTIGSVSLENESSTAEIQVKNESLTLHCDNKLKAVTPDLIIVIDTESGKVVQTENWEQLKNKELIILAAPCHDLLRSPQALEVVGPKAMGYELEYQPIAELM